MNELALQMGSRSAPLEKLWAMMPLSDACRRLFAEIHAAKLEYFWSAFTGNLPLEARVEEGITRLQAFKHGPRLDDDIDENSDLNRNESPQLDGTREADA